MAGYFEPTPLSDEQIAGLRRAQADAWDAARGAIERDRGAYRYLQQHAPSPWPPVDEREALYRAAQDYGALEPTPTHSPSRYTQHLGVAANLPLDAISYVFGAPGRARDAAILAAQDYNAREMLDPDTGEWRMVDPYTDRPRQDETRQAVGATGRALQSLASGLGGVVYPPLGEGRPGGPRDWRESASRLGISDSNVMALDIGTDPLTYVGLPIGRGMRAAQALRYGGGKPAYLIDSSGDVIRRLRATPSVRTQLRLP
jgi:hypothetical protein